MKTLRSREYNERGFAGAEGLVFGVLVFVFGTIIVAHAWSVIDAKIATEAAAREAARAYVESPAITAGADALAAATMTMDGHRRPITYIDIKNQADTYMRCSPIVVTVETKVSRLALPQIGRTGGVTIVIGRHTEIVDPYRSGIDGISNC